MKIQLTILSSYEIVFIIEDWQKNNDFINFLFQIISLIMYVDLL